MVLFSREAPDVRRIMYGKHIEQFIRNKFEDVRNRVWIWIFFAHVSIRSIEKFKRALAMHGKLNFSRRALPFWEIELTKLNFTELEINYNIKGFRQTI